MTDLNAATTWQFTVPDADDRRGRHIVAVVGSQWHSEIKWHRVGVGVAGTLYEGRQGYSPDDIALIEVKNGMDLGTGIVVAWMDFVVPPLPHERQGFDCALPMPVRAACAPRSATAIDTALSGEMCTRCNGEGVIRVEDRPYPNDISPTSHEESCPECTA